MARPSLVRLLVPLLVASAACQSRPAEAPAPLPPTVQAKEDPDPAQRVRVAGDPIDPLARQVEIRRTEYGVPHILSEELAGAGYGLAWVMMEDYREQVARAILQSNGRWAEAMGQEAVAGDFPGRMAHDYAAWTYHRLPPDVRQILDGFARGMNDFARSYRDVLPDWVPEDFTAHDIAARDISVWNAGAVRDFVRSRENMLGDVPFEPSATGSPSVASDELGAWMAWATLQGEGDPEVGSNAWAFGPERTTTGNTLLLRNPHLSWTAGYYEAHIRVPGLLDFYGDFRLGGPFTTIGGFNRRLGFATTNNYPVLDQVYALLRDPNDPDAYLMDGIPVPLENRRVEARYKDGNTFETESREFRFSPMGPVLFEVADTLFVLKSHRLSQFRVGEQWLRMMQAETLEEWKAGMRVRAKVSSNLTYADADGNILLFWNAAIPDLPHAFSEDPVLATKSDDVWTELHPFDELPQLLNPPGGYVQNANDPPYYTNLNQPLDPEAYPDNFPAPRLRFRSQNSLALVDTDRRLSLEDMVDLKHSMGMVLADRVKDDLVQAVRASGPSSETARAVDLLEEWDNTVGQESRGSTLFEIWAQRYFEVTDTSAQFREPWTRENPASTPRGLGDWPGAARAFDWAVDETTRRFGRWDVAWGEVHRLRAGDKDLPIGGCASALGCFRVLGYVTDDDGKFRVYRGDGWVLAVEFSDPPRAYSILAYGNSNREDSPYFYDQAELFAQNRMKKVAFSEQDIHNTLVRRYRPGEERRR